VRALLAAGDLHVSVKCIAYGVMFKSFSMIVVDSTSKTCLAGWLFVSKNGKSLKMGLYPNETKLPL
jgi:hypothetical protein